MRSVCCGRSPAPESNPSAKSPAAGGRSRSSPARTCSARASAWSSCCGSRSTRGTGRSFPVLVELARAPDADATEQIRRARDALDATADVSVSLSQHYLIYQAREPSPEDDRLVFVVPWRIGEEDGIRTQRYWREEHGPLAHRLIQEHGHEEMKRYEQIHTDRERSHGVFDARRQGLAMQYVPSMADALSATLTNLEAFCTNTELAIDELNFTQGPSLMFFENVTGE
jgi:hypothetical protein